MSRHNDEAWLRGPFLYNISCLYFLNMKNIFCATFLLLIKVLEWYRLSQEDQRVIIIIYINNIFFLLPELY